MSRDPDRWWRSRAARRTLFVLLAVVIAFLWWNAVRRGMAGRSSQIDNFIDFGRDLFVGRINVYETYEPSDTITKYPPFFGVLFLPLVFLPMAIAVSLWFWLNLVLSVVAVWFAVQVVHRPGEAARTRGRLWVPYVMAAGLVISNLETGQVNLVIIALLYGALFVHTRGRDWQGGFTLGIATALKLTPGLFVPYFMLKREWTMVAGTVVGIAVAWVAVPIALLGWTAFLDVHAAWLEKIVPFLADGTAAEGPGGFRHTNQSLSAVLHRTLTRTPAGGGRGAFYVNVVALTPATVTILVRLVSVAILAGLGWLCRPGRGERGHPEFGLECALVMVAALLISPISWINHYVGLLFPYVVAVHYVGTRPATLPGRRFLAVATIVSFLLLMTSVSILLQAFSLPFLGAVVLAAGLAVALIRERAGVVDRVPIRETRAP